MCIILQHNILHAKSNVVKHCHDVRKSFQRNGSFLWTFCSIVRRTFCQDWVNTFYRNIQMSMKLTYFNSAVFLDDNCSYVNHCHSDGRWRSSIMFNIFYIFACIPLKFYASEKYLPLTFLHCWKLPVRCQRSLMLIFADEQVMG